jgi:thioredoxin reductase (NADPH)
MREAPKSPAVAVVGAGPIGLELAAELSRAGIDHIVFEKGAIGQTMVGWPPGTQWFSSNERTAIAGVPLLTPGQQKATREEYLVYLRTVVRALGLEIRTHERVDGVEREGDRFVLTTTRRGETRRTRARAVVLTVGDTAFPRRLGIPGEDLPHVRHVLPDPHVYFQRDLLVVGGKNSAVEAALRCWHAGANVTISYRGAAFDETRVKVWLLPELKGRIRRGEIPCHFRTRPRAIDPRGVTLEDLEDGRTRLVPTDFVLLATGYVADMSLFRQLGVTLAGENEVPVFDAGTMETDVPGVYVAGTAAAGTQRSYHLFLENCHVHVHRIVAHLLGEPPPTVPPPNQLPES